MEKILQMTSVTEYPSLFSGSICFFGNIFGIFGSSSLKFSSIIMHFKCNRCSEFAWRHSQFDSVFVILPACNSLIFHQWHQSRQIFVRFLSFCALYLAIKWTANTNKKINLIANGSSRWKSQSSACCRISLLPNRGVLSSKSPGDYTGASRLEKTTAKTFSQFYPISLAAFSSSTETKTKKQRHFYYFSAIFTSHFTGD